MTNVKTGDLYKNQKFYMNMYYYYCWCCCYCY